MATGDLITRTEYLTAQGIAPGDVTVPEGERIDQLITWASDVIRGYLDRTVGLPTVTQTRQYQYEESGFLEIDDASVITDVALAVPGGTDVALTADQYRALPYGADVFTFIALSEAAPGVDPAMGFGRNIDVLWKEGRLAWNLPQIVKVTATFGWSDIPNPVKLAAVALVSNLISDDSQEFQGEAIEGYSYTRRQPPAPDAIPDDVKALLAPYVRESY